MLNLIKKSFSLDTRSLALYRLVIGLVVVVDVLRRSTHLTDFYTDLGVFPRSVYLIEMPFPWSFSLHLASGSWWFGALLFFIHFIFGVMLILGYKSRWAMLGAWVMTVSLHNRNWAINSGGDDVLRAILFLSVFLPLGNFFSLDQKKISTTKSSEIFSFWGLSFFFQVFAIYFVSYILKDSPIWREDFTAFFYALRLDIFATPLGVWLRPYPELGKILSFLTMILEWLGPLVLVFSFFFGRWWWRVRLMVVVAFMLFHLSIFLTMNIGHFPFVCGAMWVVFIPGPVWERLQSRFKFLTPKGASVGKSYPVLKLFSETFGALVLVSLVAWNLSTIRKFDLKFPLFQNITSFLHLYQEWNMFAPHPKRDNIWVEVPARLSDDSEIELLTGERDIYSIKDQQFFKLIPNEYWIKFYLTLSEREHYARYFGEFLCRKWNERKIKLVEGVELKVLEVNVYSRTNLPDGERGEILKKFSVNHKCL